MLQLATGGALFERLAARGDTLAERDAARVVRQVWAPRSRTPFRYFCPSL